MSDIFNKKKRSQIMAKIRGKDTSVEKALTCILRELGLRPEHHCTALPGTPDFVLRRQKVAIFTNGCFWHGHRDCSRAKPPTTNRAFWLGKIEGNKKRDARQQRSLRKMGWHVLTFWTCTKITHEKVLGRLKYIGIATHRRDTKGG